MKKNSFGAKMDNKYRKWRMPENLGKFDQRPSKSQFFDDEPSQNDFHAIREKIEEYSGPKNDNFHNKRW